MFSRRWQDEDDGLHIGDAHAVARGSQSVNFDVDVTPPVSRSAARK